VHCHQSLWEDGAPLFYDEFGYAGLSDIGRYYVGGLLEHAPSLLAFTNPTVNSCHRLVLGFEAPVNRTALHTGDNLPANDSAELTRILLITGSAGRSSRNAVVSGEGVCPCCRCVYPHLRLHSRFGPATRATRRAGNESFLGQR
jgi:hypothetical protein